MAGAVLRFLFFDAGSGRARVKAVPLGGGVLGPLDYGIRLHLERRSYAAPVFSPRNVVVFGRGVFSGSPLSGSHRLVFVFRSPVSRGLHVSSLGGAAYGFMGTGLHGVVVEGWSEEPGVLVVQGDGSGRVEAWWEEIGWDLVWELWRGYRGFRGVRGLALYLAERFGDVVFPRGGRPGRVMVVGPAAARSVAGGVFAPGLRRRGGVAELDPAAFDSASRGGAGSVLLRGHGVVAVVAGGLFDPASENPRLGDRELYERVAREVAGKGFLELVKSKTRKYRFDEKLGVGGTFCVNYIHYRDLVPFLGYNSVYLSKASRARLLEEFLERVWRRVAEEVFPEKGPRPWGTCGEPCLVACKKVWRGVKLDYEPGHAMGGFIGVFDPEAMKRLVELVDDLGIDAIEAGHVVAWLFDLLARGMLHPEELGLPARPVFDPTGFDPERASRINAELAERLLTGLVEHGNPVLVAVATRGLRAAAYMLNHRFAGRVQMHGRGFHDVAVYAAYGEEGYMTPNFYWSPGVVAPMPVLGRYWTLYSPSFGEPEAFAEAAFERAKAEYLVDNAGFCRFHRGWVEPLLERLYREVWGVEADLSSHAAAMLREIYLYQRRAGAEPRPWETRKTVDMVAGIAAETGHAEWAEKLVSGAAVEWWRRFQAKLLELLGLGEES